MGKVWGFLNVTVDGTESYKGGSVNNHMGLFFFYK